MEILKNEIYDCKYNDYTRELEKTKIYHIIYEDENIYIDAPFPVKHMNKLRKLLIWNDIKYKNIIIGKPDI